MSSVTSSTAGGRAAAGQTISNLVGRTEALGVNEDRTSGAARRKVLCSKCQEPIVNGAFVKTSKGETFHQKCDDVKECGGCKQPIATGGVIEAMDK